MVEATDNQVRAAQLIEELWNDPDIGARIQAKAKEKFPDVRTPDAGLKPHLDPLQKQIAAQADEMKKLREELEARDKKEKERQEASDKVTYEQKKNAAVAAFRLTEEGEGKMLEHMKATGNYHDFMGAAAFIASQNPPPPPPGPSFGPQHLDLFGSKNKDEKLAQLWRDSDGYVDSELTDFFKNPDKYVSETFGNA